ncbi:unnamed protein product [Didymodactylos carnosus]|uniref:Protein fem-1 homolog B n=1 Tax=Didymodactylos carnosus TaxID=1234261 RepID=A0A814Z3I2_9BILA|nr:unnamed protein product [Didymodactylos carnosus]CAF3999760.1 unnamed protein product [Didymodactylos carnosus]
MGQWKDNRWHIGILTWNTGETCTGIWSGNKTNGSFVDNDGTVFEGDLVGDGVAHGQGIERYIDGTCYRGTYKLGSKDGRGSMTSPDAAQYDRRHIYKLSTVLETILKFVSPEHTRLFINDFVEHSRYKWNILIIAATFGFYSSVKMLLNKFDVNVEIEGVVEYDNQIIPGTTALWCAAASSHLNIVKLLLHYGANINHFTLTYSTPLRAATFNNQLKIVQLLVANGAAIDIQNKSHGDTCLVLAASKGLREIVYYLLRNGADPNIRSHDGATALHVACEENYLECTKLLTTHENIKSKTLAGLTPLMTAAVKINPLIVEHFISNEKLCSKQEGADALELLGSFYCNNASNADNLHKTYEYLSRAMLLRSTFHISKIISPLIEEYGYQQECRTLEDLRNIRHNVDALHMETLITLERVLGTSSETLHSAILRRGGVYADEKRYDSCVTLWLRVCNLKKLVDQSLDEPLIRLVAVFAEMFENKIEVKTHLFKQVLNLNIDELNRERLLINRSMNPHWTNCKTALYLCAVAAKVLPTKPIEERLQLEKIIRRLISFNFKTRATNSALIHLCMDTSASTSNLAYKFPCSSTARLLIEFGAKVNAMDASRNTPLHIIAGCSMHNLDEAENIIESLIDNGAHTDTVNDNGKIPFDCGKLENIRRILKARARISLKCLVAKAIVKHQINYHKHVSMTLATFIRNH